MENKMETGGRGLWGLGFPKIRGTFLEIPIVRIITYLGLFWGSPVLGSYHIAWR